MRPAAVGGGDHTIPLCGNDPDAKAEVTSLDSAMFNTKFVR